MDREGGADKGDHRLRASAPSAVAVIDGLAFVKFGLMQFPYDFRNYCCTYSAFYCYGVSEISHFSFLFTFRHIKTGQRYCRPAM